MLALGTGMMTTRYQTTNITTGAIAIDLPVGDDLVVAAGVLVRSTTWIAVSGQSADHDVQVYGTISGNIAAIRLGADFAANNNTSVRVMNGGAVQGDSIGIYFAGGSNVVINEGSISANPTYEYGCRAIYLDDETGAGASQIINRGLITAAIGIYATKESLIVRNSGTIDSQGYAIWGSSSDDTVKNYGAMIGQIKLANGNDLYDGRTGTIDGVIFGGEGNDKLFAGAGDNELHGDAGHDQLVGGAGRDNLDGGAGIDRVMYTSATSGLTAHLARPWINTGDAKGDTYIGIERLTGSHFDDRLTGDAAANDIVGDDGNDVINGHLGNDTLTGGLGEDTFVFNLAFRASTNVDTITDFTPSDDTIQIDNAVFTGLSTGTLASSAFKANFSGNANDPTDRIIYESDTGRLYFDADGNGAGAKIHFATLDPGLTLTNADFVVI